VLDGLKGLKIISMKQKLFLFPAGICGHKINEISPHSYSSLKNAAGMG